MTERGGTTLSTSSEVSATILCGTAEEHDRPSTSKRTRGARSYSQQRCRTGGFGESEASHRQDHFCKHRGEQGGGRVRARTGERCKESRPQLRRADLAEQSPAGGVQGASGCDERRL